MGGEGGEGGERGRAQVVGAQVGVKDSTKHTQSTYTHSATPHPSYLHWKVVAASNTHVRAITRPKHTHTHTHTSQHTHMHACTHTLHTHTQHMHTRRRPTVIHLQDLLLALNDQGVINAHLPKFILNHSHTQTLGLYRGAGFGWGSARFCGSWGLMGFYRGRNICARHTKLQHMMQRSAGHACDKHNRHPSHPHAWSCTACCAWSVIPMIGTPKRFCCTRVCQGHAQCTVVMQTIHCQLTGTQ